MKKFISLFSLFCLGFLFIGCDEDKKEDIPVPEPPVEHISQAFEINKKLGRGINMGNAFEAPSENAWGNPWKPEYFRMMSELGFTHVRVPVRWEPRSMSSLPYTIDSDFLDRIKLVVDEALKNGLHVIINMHHHDELLENPGKEKPRFLAQWKQISDFFKSYPNELLFEILNEPNSAISPQIWNQYLAEAFAVIREKNPNRVVLIGTAEWGGISGLSQLVIPENDGNIIVTIHYYNPHEFTHQGADWSGDGEGKNIGTTWDDTEMERETIHQDFIPVKAFAQKHNVPIHIGEFGAYEKADIDSRKRWTTYLARWFEEQGFSWAYWEFSAGFGIYNPTTGQYLQPLVNALLHDLMPEPGKMELTLVYSSDFSMDNDGWFLQENGANALFEHKNGELVIDIKNTGQDGWNLQLIKTNVILEKGKRYAVSFTASSTVSRSFISYIGMNSDPWTAYSDYNTFTPTNDKKEMKYVFVMSENDVNNARIVFDLGGGALTKLTLSSFSLSEVNIIPNK